MNASRRIFVEAMRLGYKAVSASMEVIEVARLIPSLGPKWREHQTEVMGALESRIVFAYYMLKRHPETPAVKILVDEIVAYYFPQKTITGSDESPYMTKYRLWKRKRFGSVHIHEFHRGDLDAEHHNHPFRYGFSIILHGGYVDERTVAVDNTLQFELKRRRLTPGSLNFIGPNTFHRAHMEPGETCFTLFFQTAADRSWGFMHPESRAYESSGEFFERKGLTKPKHVTADRGVPVKF